MPYTPSVQPNSSFLFQGILNAAQSISDAMEKRDEQAQQQIDGGKAVDFMLKASPQLKQRLGLTDKEIGALGPREKISLGQGLMKSLALEQIVGEIGDAARKRRAAEEMPGLLERFAGRVNPAGAGPAMPPLAAFGSVAQNFPEAAAQLSPHLLSKLLPDGENQGEVMPKETKFGDLRVIYNPKGGNFQIDPAYGIDRRAAADEKKNEPADPGEPPDVEPPRGFVWAWDGKRWTQKRRALNNAEALTDIIRGGVGASASAGPTNTITSGKYKVRY